MKKFWFVGLVLLTLGTLIFAGCSASANKISVQSPPANLAITVLPGMKLGSDGNLHDAFSPATLTVTQGQTVNITAYNYDDMPHSFTSEDLNVNQKLAPSTTDGQAGVTTFSFTPTKAGTYTFKCIDKCDIEANQWAMNQMGYMIGQVVVEPAAG